MQRLQIEPRQDWVRTVEGQGLLFGESAQHRFWDESAYYRLSERDVEQLEKATQSLASMCIEAGEHIIREDRMAEVGIPRAFQRMVRESWERNDPSLYGRFDLVYDGVRPPRLLEFNADTPTALLEAAVVQWYWFKDRFPDLDQYNSIHEKLIAAWESIKPGLAQPVYFTCLEESLEDYMTTTYLRDTAVQAGLATRSIAIEQVGWNAPSRRFVDERERPMESVFKLYPWEWLQREEFGVHLPEAPTRWLEPPWKAMWSNKAILAILWDLFPSSPYLVPASLKPIDGACVRKPVHSREGANIQVIEGGRIVGETPGPYSGPYVYQRQIPVTPMGGRYPVVGSWIVGGEDCGIGIREDATPITSNLSAFVPHVFVPADRS
jgi:glutathionylspermidine synthase